MPSATSPYIHANQYGDQHSHANRHAQTNVHTHCDDYTHTPTHPHARASHRHADAGAYAYPV